MQKIEISAHFCFYIYDERSLLKFAVPLIGFWRVFILIMSYHVQNDMMLGEWMRAGLLWIASYVEVALRRRLIRVYWMHASYTAGGAFCIPRVNEAVRWVVSVIRFSQFFIEWFWPVKSISMGCFINSLATRLFHHGDSIIGKIGTPCRGSFKLSWRMYTSGLGCLLCGSAFFKLTCPIWLSFHGIGLFLEPFQSIRQGWCMNLWKLYPGQNNIK